MNGILIILQILSPGIDCTRIRVKGRVAIDETALPS
jgi:hypothetical protein